jgi:hypothetical protein
MPALPKGAALTGAVARLRPRAGVHRVVRQVRREVRGHADRPDAGPPPPCGMQKVLCRLRWHTSAPIAAGEVRPTCAFMFAPSM